MNIKIRIQTMAQDATEYMHEGFLESDILAKTLHFNWVKEKEGYFLDLTKDIYSKLYLIIDSDDSSICFKDIKTKYQKTYRINDINSIIDDYTKILFYNDFCQKMIAFDWSSENEYNKIKHICLVNYEALLILNKELFHIPKNEVDELSFIDIKNAPLSFWLKLKGDPADGYNVFLPLDDVSLEMDDDDDVNDLCVALGDDDDDDDDDVNDLCLSLNYDDNEDKKEFLTLEKLSHVSHFWQSFKLWFDHFTADHPFQKEFKNLFERYQNDSEQPKIFFDSYYLEKLPLNEKDVKSELFNIYDFFNIIFSANFMIENKVVFNKQKYKSYVQYEKLIKKANAHILNYKEQKPKIAQIVRNGTLRIIQAINDNKLDDMRNFMPNFSGVIEYISDRNVIMRHANKFKSFKPLLLNGPAGIGKTHFAYALADACDTSLNYIMFATVTSSFILNGLDFSWQGGKIGKVMNTLVTQPYFNPVIICDEFEKSASDNKNPPLNGMFNLFEPITNTRFLDEAFDLEIDTSGFMWILTTNTTSSLPEPILSRVNVFEIEDIHTEDKEKVIYNIYQSTLRNLGLETKFDDLISKNILQYLTQYPTREIYKKIENLIVDHLKNKDEDKIQLTDVKDVDTPKKSFGFI